MKTILHLDLDAFFVSVERILDPSLIGKPVIVGGNPKGRGVISTCSYEARKYGLHSGMPTAKAYKLCPHGIYIHGTHGEYSKFSNAVREILEKYIPELEQASIDEFYMDLTGCEKIYGNMFMFASKLQKEIYEETLLPCSIGISTNKTVAKIATDSMKPNGITYVIPGMEKEFLRRMPLEAIPGVGKVMIKKLHLRALYKIGDVADLSDNYLKRTLGKYGLYLKRKANGLGRDHLSEMSERKSISKERTYGKDVRIAEEIEATLFKLTGKVSQLIRDKKWLTSSISIKLRYSDYSTITRSTIIKATDDDKIIFGTAVNLFRKNYKTGSPVRLIGIHLTKFTGHNLQEFLFEDKFEKRKNMLEAVNKLRDRYGYDYLKFVGYDSFHAKI
ncbi:MAG: hypothetical protein A2068_04640 [Ignavibacteria bacterium GWB2_35_6b]|nr:MAG: hypothetical protein A2068_04640 [Ignavibacteria bacterium GWB2_35_6b]